MNLYVLRRIAEVNYDEYEGFVVRAVSEEHARALAAEGINWSKNERAVWLFADKSTCELLTSEGADEVILESFHAG